MASSRSSCSGVSSSAEPKFTSPPATFTTTSSPPSCSRATATACRAASGVVRSPAEARTSKPCVTNSFARVASPTAFTSAITSFAPAAANPKATAWPICPTRATPVTSATLPRKSGGTAWRVESLDDHLDGRRPARGERLRAIARDHVHRALDPRIIVLQGVIGARDRALRIRQQRKVKLHLCDVARVALHPRRIDPEGLNASGGECCQLVAHGGELAVSAGSVVARIKDERDVARLEDICQTVGLAVGRRRRERRRLAADLEELAHRVALLAASSRRASSRSSHSSGMSSPPSGAWESPKRVSPCQSEPPLSASPRRSAIRVRRASVAEEGLGGGPPIPSRPLSPDCPVCPPLPPPPPCAPPPAPPTPWNRWGAPARGRSR